MATKILKTYRKSYNLWTISSFYASKVRIVTEWRDLRAEGKLFEKATSEPKNIRTVLSVNSAEETKIIFDAQTGKLLETRRMSYQ